MDEIEMTAAEFKTIREKWGLTTNWLADTAAVNERTVKYWEGGQRIPKEIAAMMYLMDRRLEEAITGTVDHVLSIEPPPDEIVLIRYKTDEDLLKYRPDMLEFPAKTHAMMLARTKVELERNGISVRIYFMEPKAYDAWLKAAKKADSEQARAEWASTLE